MSSNQEHIDRLTEAQNLLREALDILKDVASETKSGSADAYLIPSIEQSIDDNHDWIGYHYNIQDWIDELGDEEVYGFEDTDALTPADHAAYEAMQADEPERHDYDAYDPALDGVVKGVNKIQDVKAWREETGDSLSTTFAFVNAIWKKRGYGVQS